MKTILISIIRFYQRIFSPETGFLPRILGKSRKACVFYPSCSEYAVSSIEKHGVVLGSWHSFSRILRCNPWQEPKEDPVK